MENKKLIKIFYKILSSNRKRQVFLLLLLMVISSVAELFSFSLLFPFITALTNPDLIFKQQSLKPILELLNIKNDHSLQLNLTVFFTISVFLSMIIRILSLWANVKLSFKMGSDIGYQMFEKILKRPYKDHISKNSNDVINGITYKSSQIIYGGFLPLITVVSNTFLVFSILIPLLYFYPYVTIAMTVFLVVIYIILAVVYKKTLLLNGRILSDFSSSIMRTLKESLISIRDLILDGTQSIYLSSYKISDKKMKDALGSSQFIGLSPRYFIESFSIILIAIFSYFYIIRQGNLAIMLPLLGTFLLAFQRLLPAAQQIYNNWTAFLGNKAMMEEVIETLLLKDSEYVHIQDGDLMKFDSSIKLENVSFKYNEADKIVLNNINLFINKGEKIAIIGGTGNGKSTLKIGRAHV
jgi:ATP-binding cassette subfamily B protein